MWDTSHPAATIRWTPFANWAPRLKLVHLKDIQAADGEVNVLLGKGISKIPEVMQELHRQNFAGLVAVEYEKEGDVNEDMRQDMEFARKLAEGKS